MNDFTREIGAVLLEVLLLEGVKPMELARRLRWHPAFLYSILFNSRSISFQTLVSIAVALNYTLEIKDSEDLVIKILLVKNHN